MCFHVRRKIYFQQKSEIFADYVEPDNHSIWFFRVFPWCRKISCQEKKWNFRWLCWDAIFYNHSWKARCVKNKVRIFIPVFWGTSLFYVLDSYYTCFWGTRTLCFWGTRISNYIYFTSCTLILFQFWQYCKTNCYTNHDRGSCRSCFGGTRALYFGDL